MAARMTSPPAVPPGYLLAFASAAGRRRSGTGRPVPIPLTTGDCRPAGGPAGDGFPAGAPRHPWIGAGFAFPLGRWAPGDEPIGTDLGAGLGTDLGAGLGADLGVAVDLVRPALLVFDLPDGTWPDGTRPDGTWLDGTRPDEPATGAGLAGVLLGGLPRPAAGPDLRLAGCLLHRNGELAGSGAGGVLLGSPVEAVRHLARELGGRGWPLAPGQLLVVGSPVPEVPVTPGDRVTLQVAGFAPVTVVLPTPREGGENDD